jgi:hypothetical protein
MGYSPEEWTSLESDIRTQLLVEDVALTRETPWGTRYEIVGNLVARPGAARVCGVSGRLTQGQERRD